MVRAYVWRECVWERERERETSGPSDEIDTPEMDSYKRKGAGGNNAEDSMDDSVRYSMEDVSLDDDDDSLRDSLDDSSSLDGPLRASAETELDVDEVDDEFDEIGGDDEEDDDDEDTDDAEDPALALFTMQITDKSGQTDYSLLFDDGQPLCLRDKQTISLNWDLDAYDRYYLESEENRLDVHESVTAPEEQLKKTVSLQDCFEIFSAEEKLGPEDQVYCSGCKEFRQSTKKMDIWRLPPILVIHLKRFSYKNRYYREKLDTLVEFPLTDLDLTNQQLADTTDTPAVYDLMAVSNHFGSLGGGHYTAFGKHVNDGCWYKFDDSHVSKVDEASVCSTAAYVLFYRRKDTLDWDLGMPAPFKYIPPTVDEPTAEPIDEEEEEEEEEGEEDVELVTVHRTPAADPPSHYSFEEEEEEEEDFEIVGDISDEEDLDAHNPFEEGDDEGEEDGTRNNVD